MEVLTSHSPQRSRRKQSRPRANQRSPRSNGLAGQAVFDQAQRQRVFPLGLFVGSSSKPAKASSQWLPACNMGRFVLSYTPSRKYIGLSLAVSGQDPIGGLPGFAFQSYQGRTYEEPPCCHEPYAAEPETTQCDQRWPIRAGIDFALR